MKIINLKVENFKRLKAVEVTPSGNVVTISGRNGQGKTSLLDSIVASLGGKRVHPPKPIRNGETEAKIELNLGELRVVQRWKGERESLEVYTDAGAKYPSPQSVLDKLVGDLTFDPLAFTRMSAAMQASILAKLAGVDLDAYGRKRKELYDARTMTNRDVKATEGQVNAITVPPGTPDEEINVTALMGEFSAAKDKIAANEKAREGLKRLVSEGDALVAEIEAMQRALAEKDAKAKELAKRIEAGKIHVDGLKDPDTKELEQKVAKAQGVNRAVALKIQRQAREKALDELRKRSEQQTKDIAALDTEKDKAIAAAKLPVDGLSLGEDGVTLAGIPFSQASGAEQLRVSVAMGLALNPKLKVMLVRDGSLMDEESLGLLARMAAEQDAQVWIERVAAGDPVGVVIEDGEVKEVAGELPLGVN